MLTIYIKPSVAALGQPRQIVAHALDWGYLFIESTL